MTAKKWAEIAFDDARRQSAAGNDTRAFTIASQALAVIARYGNQIPNTVQYVGRDGASIEAVYAGSGVDSDTRGQCGDGYVRSSVIPLSGTPEYGCKPVLSGAIPDCQHPNSEVTQ